MVVDNEGAEYAVIVYSHLNLFAIVTHGIISHQYNFHSGEL